MPDGWAVTVWLRRAVSKFVGHTHGIQHAPEGYRALNCRILSMRCWAFIGLLVAESNAQKPCSNITAVAHFISLAGKILVAATIRSRDSVLASYLGVIGLNLCGKQLGQNEELAGFLASSPDGPKIDIGITAKRTPGPIPFCCDSSTVAVQPYPSPSRKPGSPDLTALPWLSPS